LYLLVVNCFTARCHREDRGKEGAFFFKGGRPFLYLAKECMHDDKKEQHILAYFIGFLEGETETNAGER